MKKTVVIGGASRSGKSLLAHALFEATKCTVIHADQLCGSIRKAYPTVIPKDADHDALLCACQNVIVHLIQCMGQDFDYVRVFESQFLDPETVADRLTGAGYTCLFVGYPTITPEAKLDELRLYGHRNAHCWTNDRTDEQLLHDISTHIQLSKKQKSKCETVGIPYFDTGTDFSAVFAEAREHILERLANKELKATE